MKVGLPLMKNVHTSLIKSALKPLGLTAVTSKEKVGIHKIILASGTYGSGTIILIISNKEMEDCMKIVKSLKDSGLLIKGYTKTIEN